MQADQEGSIRVQDLAKVVMSRRCLELAKESLVPLQAARYVSYANDRACAFHRVSVVGLRKSLPQTPDARGSTGALKRTTIPGMRGDDRQPDSMFSYVSAERRVPPDHPMRVIRALVDDGLRDLSPDYDQGVCSGHSS